MTIFVVGAWILLGIHLVALLAIPSTLKKQVLEVTTSDMVFSLLIDVVAIAVAIGLFITGSAPVVLGIVALAWLVGCSLYGIVKVIQRHESINVFLPKRALNVFIRIALTTTSLIILLV